MAHRRDPAARRHGHRAAGAHLRRGCLAPGCRRAVRERPRQPDRGRRLRQRRARAVPDARHQARARRRAPSRRRARRRCRSTERSRWSTRAGVRRWRPSTCCVATSPRPRTRRRSSPRTRASTSGASPGRATGPSVRACWPMSSSRSSRARRSGAWPMASAPSRSARMPRPSTRCASRRTVPTTWRPCWPSTS